MKVTLGKKGLKETWQDDFPKTTECVKCGKNCRIGFVAHEDVGEKEYVCNVHKAGKNSYWLHDACSVAVYFCKGCLNPTALYNQA